MRSNRALSRTISSVFGVVMGVAVMRTPCGGFLSGPIVHRREPLRFSRKTIPEFALAHFENKIETVNYRLTTRGAGCSIPRTDIYRAYRFVLAVYMNCLQPRAGGRPAELTWINAYHWGGPLAF